MWKDLCSDDNVRKESGGAVGTDDAVNAVLCDDAGENAHVEWIIVQRSRIEARDFIVLFVPLFMREREMVRTVLQMDAKRNDGNNERRLTFCCSRQSDRHRNLLNEDTSDLVGLSSHDSIVPRVLTFGSPPTSPSDQKCEVCVSVLFQGGTFGSLCIRF